MDSHQVPRRALYWALAVLAGPFVGVLLALVFLGELALGGAALGAAVAVAALWFPVRRHLSGLVRLVDRLGRLDAASAPERVHLESPLVSRRLASSIADSTAALHQRLGELATSGASAAAVMDNLPDPVIAIDGARRIVRASRGTTAILGVDPVGSDLVTALRDPGVLEAAERVIATSEPEEVDFQIAGSDLELAARIAALPEPAPDGTVALIAVTDVTAIRSHGRTRADFVANASHELRTPISVLLGCIETLRGSARQDAAASDRFLEMMDTQTQRMSRLVNDLLSLSRIELNEHLPPSSTVPLSSVIPPVVDSLQFAARSRRIDVTIDSDIPAPGVVGDRDELTQLFQNLIDNAIKYGAEGSSVRIAIGDGTMRKSGGPDAGGRRHPGRGLGRGRRHSAGTPSAPDGAVLSGGYGALAGDGRHRAGARDRQAHRQPAPGSARHRERARRRQRVHRELAARAAGTGSLSAARRRCHCHQIVTKVS